MQILPLAVLIFVLTGPAAFAMPGATVGIPLGSPDPFGTIRRDAAPPAASPDEPERSIERRTKKARPSRQRAPKARR